MKAYDIVGYVQDGAFTCTDCHKCHGENCGCAPVFASEEFDHYPTCDICLGLCDDVALTEYGMEYEYGIVPSVVERVNTRKE